jgi:hypothetical protein
MTKLLVNYATFTPIELGNKEDKSPKWNMIAKPIVSKSHAAGDFELTTEMFHAAVKNFKLRSTGKVPIKFDHHSSEHPSYDPRVGSPAQGYITDMQVRADGCLYGLCDFLEPARTYVLEEKYQWFSPGLLLDSLDRTTGKRAGMRVKEVSLVDDPHLYDMPSVRASNDEREVENTLTPETEPDKTKKDSNMTKELETEVADLKNKVREKDLKIAELTLEHKTALSEVQLKLDNKIREYEKLEKEAVDGEVEMVFNTYKDSRKLTDADKVHLKTLRLANADSFRSLFPAKAPEAAKPATKPAVSRPAYLTTSLSNESRPAAEGEVRLSQAELHTKFMKEGMDSTSAAIAAAKAARGNKLWHN